jgi:histidine triad (HIT) family protein
MAACYFCIHVTKHNKSQGFFTAHYEKGDEMGAEKKTKCIFCDIIEGKAEAYKIFEDETSLCILDIHPYTKGHCLVIPKRHVTWWHELTIDETESLFRVARTCANKMMKAFSPDFIFMYARGRRIPHTHIFLIPTFKDDVLDRFFHALEKFQESPQDLALIKEKEQLAAALELLQDVDR